MGTPRLESSADGRARLQRAIDLWWIHGKNHDEPARALGVGRSTFGHILKRAQALGYQPSPDAVLQRDRILRTPPPAFGPASPDMGSKPKVSITAAMQAGAEPMPWEATARDQQRLRDEITRLRRELADAHRELNADDDLRKAVFGLASMDYTPPDWTVDIQPSDHQTRGTPILFTSDKQFGEVVRADEVNGYNAYDVEIAERRHVRMVEASLDLCFNHEHNRIYDGVVYIRGGDEISGEIHQELAETNELSAIPAAKRLIELEVWAIEQLRQRFDRVHVVSVCGNHGRTTFKPRAKRYSDLNYESLIAWAIEREFKAHPEITFLTPPSGDAYFRIYDRNVLVTHGDRIGSRGGQGFIGPIATILRGMRKLQTQYSRQGKPVDYVLTGHFHTSFKCGFGFANGSPCGYNEFAHMLRCDPEPPQQWLLFAHPRRGITHGYEVQLDDPPPAMAARALMAPEEFAE